MSPFIIPIFLPQMGCPYHCLYCNQKTITQSPNQGLTRETFIATVEAGLSSKKKKPGQEIEIAFFGGTFTNLPEAFQERLLKWAAPYLSGQSMNAKGLSSHQPDTDSAIRNPNSELGISTPPDTNSEIRTPKSELGISSIRISTRPDALSEIKIEQLLASGVGTIELGIQSLEDKVLTLSNRGHTAQAAFQALGLLKKYPVRIGVQLMVGLPGDTAGEFLRTVKQVTALKPHLVRIYPTLVLKDTALSQWFYEGRYHPLSLDETLSLCSQALEIFKDNGIRVIRMGLQENDGLRLGKDLIAGPYHPAFGSLVRGELFLKKVLKGLQSQKPLPPRLTLEISPSDVSYLTGNKRKNLDRLIRETGLSGIKVLVKKSFKTGQWNWFY